VQPLFLPNGSACDSPLTQILEAQQHGQHFFKLAVEMYLVPADRELALIMASIGGDWAI
jgi:hypothetical protein